MVLHICQCLSNYNYIAILDFIELATTEFASHLLQSASQNCSNLSIK